MFCKSGCLLLGNLSLNSSFNSFLIVAPIVPYLTLLSPIVLRILSMLILHLIVYFFVNGELSLHEIYLALEVHGRGIL